MKQRIAAAFIMGIITTGLISFTLISINVGFTEKFLARWIKSWGMAYVLIVPVILFVGPKVQQLVSYLFRNK
ncbi:DUF2798 domain-containing protein [Flavobacterium aquariorum]|uniref:DUF2798 domain-containing protein n=1 Tax=Flavobacterium aquariorum TaxID=2217670 RepID=A0A2W7U7Q7_9FLAO|nr:DUF2798 domain-containing protein [Flavobacterium aquariorum]PZX93319.1 DUF2798 domain-containing protein [Flavobacterium aquariorum]